MLHSTRTDYEGQPLDVSDLDADPLRQLGRWLAEAIADDRVVEPTAMALATADERGRPSCRMVLLKGVDDRGLVFFTNYRSRKGRDLASNPQAAVTLFWGPLHRQVNVHGSVAQVPPEESDAYFASRPRGARLGAAASPQSEVIPDRQVLERTVAELAAAHPDDVPRPAHWGGYVLHPDEVIVWQGRRDRLHDRFRYGRADPSAHGQASTWTIERLAP